MEADLFSPQDTAALLAIRQAAAEGPMSVADVVEAFRAAGLLEEVDRSVVSSAA